MIGGIDVHIPSPAGDGSGEPAVRAVRQIWPTAVFENGLTGERYAQFWEIPFAGLEELFIYRDGQAARLWDDEGAVEAALNSMIHIIIENGLLTVVVDKKDLEMQAIIAAIESALNDEILFLEAAA